MAQKDPLNFFPLRSLITFTTAKKGIGWWQRKCCDLSPSRQSAKRKGLSARRKALQICKDITKWRANLVPARGQANRIAPLPCSKELYPGNDLRDRSSERRKITTWQSSHRFRHHPAFGRFDIRCRGISTHTDGEQSEVSEDSGKAREHLLAERNRRLLSCDGLFCLLLRLDRAETIYKLERTGGLLRFASGHNDSPICYAQLKPGYRTIIAISCLSVAASAYGVELFLQVSDSTVSVRRIMSIPSQERKDMAAKFGRRFGFDIDIRDRHEVIADLRKQGIEVVPQVLLPVSLEKQPDNRKSSTDTGGVEIMPLGGIANKTTVACNQSGKYLTYDTDEHGFHNPKGIWQSGHIDIAAVGNSFTLGYCVPSDKNFVALIRRRYPVTLNLGMPGKGPLQILATLKEYALLLKPKLVLWFYSEANSLPELQYERQSRILRGYLRGDFSQGLLGRQLDIDQACTSKIDRQTSLEITSEARTQEKGSKRVDQLLEFIKLGHLRRKLSVNYGEAVKRREKSCPSWSCPSWKGT